MPTAPWSVAPSAASASVVTACLLAQAGPHRLALPVSHVVEVMRLLPIEPVAGAPALVRGVCMIRGVPLPVVDARLLFDDEPGRCGRLIAVRAGARSVALAVQAVIGVHAIPNGVFREMPPLLRKVDTVAAIATLDAELMFLLQCGRLLPEGQTVATESAA